MAVHLQVVVEVHRVLVEERLMVVHCFPVLVRADRRHYQVDEEEGHRVSAEPLFVLARRA